MAFRLRPLMEFDRILSVSSFGETGETYAFNEDGFLVSKSRFDPQLKKMGLLSNSESSIFNIQLRDPGRDLRIKSIQSGESFENWSFTEMAKSALSKNSGVNVAGYNDYRGIPVVGVWTWLENQQLGIATEIDSEEAFAPLNTLLFWYRTLFGLLVIALFIGLFLRSRILKTRKQNIENQERLVSLTGIIFDSVVAINQEGIIQTVNPAVEKVLGYSPTELIGENVAKLMPEPYSSKHDGYLDNYLRTGKKKIINTVTEVEGLKKDGTVFPMEICVSESTTDEEKVFVGVLRDISERKAHEQAIDDANRERNLIFNSAGEGIYGIDLEGNTTFVNPAACKMLGYTEIELLGKEQHNMIHHSLSDGTHYPKDDCPIHGTIRNKKDHHECDEVFWKKDGTSFPVEYISKPITDQGKIIGAVVTFTDITARRAAEEELKHAYHVLEERIKERTQEIKAAKELAENHNQAKSEFLSRMSHELRTPMNAILGFAQIMNESKKDPLPDSHKKRLGQILKAGNHLLELINEVLDLARVEAGKITVSLEPVNIAELVSDKLNVIRPMAEKFNIQVIDKISSHNDIYVLADKTRLKQVLLNLTSNGIKYNRKFGRVTMSIDKHEGEFLNIHITDTGMGISSEKLKRIFEPFDRLGAEGSEVEGTGIGMTISKKLVELMNGQINVYSTPGEGSQFSISLPLGKSTTMKHKESFEITENSYSEFSTKHLTVLYIEDNKANMLLVQDILSNYLDINLLTAQQAQTGLDLAHAHQPDLILMDINLPDLDGFEILKRLQNMEETHQIPVIAISANAMQSDIKSALEAGFKTYLTKPLNIDQFKGIIEKYLATTST
ncbi:MAG: PAS domain S-box protein [Nitrospinota bacterium]